MVLDIEVLVVAAGVVIENMQDAGFDKEEINHVCRFVAII